MVRDGGDQVVGSLGSGSLGEGRARIWGRFGSKACSYDVTVGAPTAESCTIHHPGGLSVDCTIEEMQSRDWSIGSSCCRIVPGT